MENPTPHEKGVSKRCECEFYVPASSSSLKSLLPKRQLDPFSDFSCLFAAPFSSGAERVGAVLIGLLRRRLFHLGETAVFGVHIDRRISGFLRPYGGGMHDNRSSALVGTKSVGTFKYLVGDRFRLERFFGGFVSFQLT